MFYTQCNDCNKRWELGTASTCKCPDFWEGYIPEPVKPAQHEPVATITITQRGPIRIVDNNFDDCVRNWPDGEYKLYTSPPAQRTWVGLTDEAIWLKYQRIWPFHPAEEPTLAKAIIKFARAIEAAHGIKEKNT